MDIIQSNKRIALNTGILYLRMFVVVLVNLYTSRVLLQVLGVDDYGIYNVVAGIVTMLGFLNTAMVAASQRFITFELGRGDALRQNKVYSTSVLIHATIAVVVVLIAETLGLWFVNNRLNIDPGRMDAANWAYHSAVAVFLIKIMTVPNHASVIAHEKMGVYAFVSVLDAFLQLGIVFLLRASSADSLILYSLLLTAVAAVDWLVYKFYARMRFGECRFHLPKDGRLYREMLGFAGWSFLGNLGISMRGPGVNVVVNMFCAPAVNAARGIAYQVSSVLSNLVANFQMALAPQITKRYAAGEKDSMLSLVNSGARLSSFLLSFAIVPLCIRTGYVLDLWLVDVPEYTVQFLRAVLIVAMFNSMVGPYTTSIQATGRIMVFQLAIALIMVLEIPAAWILLTMGLPPYSVVFASIGIEIIALVVRMVLAGHQVGLDIRYSLVRVLGCNTLLLALMFSVPLLVNRFIPEGLAGLVLFVLLCFLWCGVVILCFGITGKERKAMPDFVRSSLRKLFAKTDVQER